MPIVVANPTGDGWNDLPRLLRAAADELEAQGVDCDAILDMTVEEEAIGESPYWVVRVQTAFDDDGAPSPGPGDDDDDDGDPDDDSGDRAPRSGGPLPTLSVEALPGDE